VEEFETTIDHLNGKIKKLQTEAQSRADRIRGLLLNLGPVQKTHPSRALIQRELGRSKDGRFLE
jgi:hypothetical protein